MRERILDAIETILAVLIVIGVILAAVLCSYIVVYADPDVNVDHGGGSVGTGTTEYQWANHREGIRVSVYDTELEQTVGMPRDYSNATTAQVSTWVEHWWGFHSKLYYAGTKNTSGKRLTPNFSTYRTLQFENRMPEIITDSSVTTEDIKNFFRDETVIREVASNFGISYDVLISGKYKLLLEPVVYVVYKGEGYCFSATEIAVFELYHEINPGTMKNRIGAITHQNAPLSMFLEYTDIEIPAWSGNTTGKQNARDILYSLGIGIISFRDEPPVDNPDGNNPTGSVTITKIDADSPSTMLPGAKFMLENKSNNKKYYATSDSDGKATFKVPLGSYLLQEVEAPGGYTITASTITINLTASNPTASYTLPNRRETVSGDHIIYAYQLTNYFDQTTAFSNPVNYPADVKPSPGKCSDNGYTRVVDCLDPPSEDIKSRASWGSIVPGTESWRLADYLVTAEWTETIPAHTEWGVIKTDTLPNGNKKDIMGLIDVPEKEITHPEVWGKRMVYSYQYKHNDYHWTDFTWNGYNVTVYPSNYISSGVFNDSGAMAQYKILHNGGNYLLAFNHADAFSLSRLTKLFEPLDTVKWISHRNGGLTSQSQEIKLASYMSNRAANQSYKAFYKTYTGNTPNEAYSNANNTSYYGSSKAVKTTTIHGGVNGGVARSYTKIFCNGGKDPNAMHPSTSNTATLDYKYAVEGTYKAGDRTVRNAVSGDSLVVTKDGYSKQIFQMPSNTFTFYPTYKMYYTNTLGSVATKNSPYAWMLSAGKRTFQATDAIEVAVSGGGTDVWAPWSRDWEDKYEEDSEWGNEEKRDYSVIKSGMVVKAVQKNDIEITIRAAFHVQDPDFVDASMQESVKAANAAKEAEMRGYVEDIKQTIFGTELPNKRGVFQDFTFGFYTNLWEGTSSAISAASNGKLDMPVGGTKGLSWAKSESPKTRLEPINKQIRVQQSEYTTCYMPTHTDFTAADDCKTLIINGNRYDGKLLVTGMSDYMFTLQTLRSLLDCASHINNSGKHDIGAIADSQDGTAWYEEFYNGIYVCQITYKFTIPAEAISTEYVQVHSQLSDSTTAMNELAENMMFPGTKRKLFSDGMFGIGLCVVSKNGLDLGANSYGNVYLIFPPKEFGVRGSVYDLAQNAPQYFIRLH